MSQSLDDFLRDFSEPDPHFSPVPFWWWSGEKLEIGRLLWQMDQLFSMGIRNVIIINLAPSGTMFGSDADDPPFLSEEWWSIFARVCDHAKSIKMSIWFYDQIGFSGASYQADIAGAHPECLARQLRRVVVEGTGNLQADCPIAGTPIAAYWLPLSSPLDVRYVTVDGKHVSIRSDEPAKLCLVYSLSQGYDFFSGPACERLLDVVHRQFERRLPEHLGSTIVGSFQDELPDLPTWGQHFCQTFQQKYGYALQSVVHRLFEEGDIDSRRTRLHYHAHRADLTETAFFKPFFDWHQKRRLQCGFDQQSPAREARVLASVLKYADYTQTHRWYAIPGSDLHGNGKLHSSIAFMNKHQRVWLEGFHSTGWGGTIADTFDWLLPYLEAGANLYNPHAVYYSTRKGWWEWAPPSTCWRQPYARHYHVFADMIARLTRILSWGIQQATVAVLFPTATVQSAAGPQEHFADAVAADQTLHEVIGSMRWHQAKLGPLDELGIGFHLLDEPAIQNADVRDGNLRVRDVPLGTVILPRVTMLHDATVDQLKAFAASGGKIVAIGAEEIETVGGKRISIRSLPNAVIIDSAASLPAALKDLHQTVHSPVPVLHRRDGGVNVLFVPAVAGMATVVKWPGWFSPIEHSTIVPERYRDSVEILLAENIGEIRRFDPREGSSAPVSTKSVSGGTRVLVNFDGSPFAVLVWREGKNPDSLPLYQEGEIVVLGDEWTCEYLPTLPMEYADIYDPAQPELRWPHTADFQWNHEGRQEIVRATFGVRAWRGESQSDQPISYSPKFGILQDRLHINTLGPKGHVPEEFIDLGKMKKSERVTIRTGVVSGERREAILIVGANARKSAKTNGESLGESGPEYLWTTPINLKIGENPIELALAAERDETVRLFWCLADPARVEEFLRPERITTTDAVSAGTTVSYLCRFETNEPVVENKIKISAASIASAYLDGKLLGRQGGFDPYRPMMRGQIYSLPRLEQGKHELRVEVVQPERPAPLMVDGRAELMSGMRWTFSCEAGDDKPVTIYSRQESDAGAWFLQRRPHPLPAAAWLDERYSDVVLDLPLIPPSPETVTQSLSWTIPPGAMSMRIPLAAHNSVNLLIDETQISISTDGAVDLSGANSASRRAVLQIAGRQLGGGLLDGPVTYQFGPGLIRTGSWMEQGLRSYSGAMRLKQHFVLPPKKQGRIMLDLGRVRGTVEAAINGQAVGVRCLGPYRFDLTEFVRNGENELELIVTNTLGNFLSTWSPTSWWSPDQLEAGVFGPVRILTEIIK